MLAVRGPARSAPRQRSRRRPLVVLPQRGRRRAVANRKLPVKRVVAVPDAPARLGPDPRRGEPRRARRGQPAPGKRSDGVETSVEVAWPGVARGPLRPKSLADAVADRFGAEMQALSPACAIAPAPDPDERVVEIVESRVLAGNPLGDPTARRIAVWLPPSYGAAPDAPLSGHLLAVGLRGDGRDVVLGNAVAAGSGRSARPAGRVRRDGRGDRRGARRLHALGRRAVPRFAGDRQLRDAHRARGDPGDRRALPHASRRATRARSAASRRAVSARSCWRCATRSCSRPWPATRATCTSSCRALPDLPGRGAHAAPPRRRRRFPAPVRREGEEGRRRLHDHHGAGAGGRLFARSGTRARHRAAVRSRHGRDRLDRVAALEEPGIPSRWSPPTPRRCGG